MSWFSCHPGSGCGGLGGRRQGDQRGGDHQDERFRQAHLDQALIEKIRYAGRRPAR
jgi:hypothetical protein